MLSYTGYTSYAPSKYAVKGLADGLRLELQRHHIQVGCLYPPNMDTPCLKQENETKPEEGLFVEKYLESLFHPSDIARKAITHIKKGDPHIYCDFDAWGVNLTSCGLGPYNNIFTSLLFVIPGMIFTNLFRLLLLGIYKMKRFSGNERQSLWIHGANSLKEDKERQQHHPSHLSSQVKQPTHGLNSGTETKYNQDELLEERLFTTFESC